MSTTQSTTTYNPGDVVLVSFVFSDETGAKRRPAVVVSSRTFNDRRAETILAAITGNVNRVLVAEHLLSGWRGAGLRRPSVVTALLRTINKSRIVRKIGRLAKSDFDSVLSNLKIALAIT